MTNMIVLNTRNDLIDLLDNNDFDTLVGRVAFALDLLDHVRANDNTIEIDEDLGYADDGGWIEIDEMGYVIADEYLPWKNPKKIQENTWQVTISMVDFKNKKEKEREFQMFKSIQTINVMNGIRATFEVSPDGDIWIHQVVRNSTNQTLHDPLLWWVVKNNIKAIRAGWMTVPQ